ncbi:MAG: hypothetical protein K8S21_11135 [Gemmatimonadetes bacterium]|nr:hypothetical protein [Gemmatimonadota bacterium]
MRLSTVGLRAVATATAILVVTSPIARAQSATSGAPAVDPRLYSALSWRNLGPFRAGRVSAVAGAIGSPGVFYAGFPGGGLWKTTSAGQVWFPVFDSVREVSSVGAVEVAPSDPNVVYVGTGDMITGGTLDRGNGVYKSTDAGATWRSIGLQDTRHIQTMLVDPRSADVVLVGALGDHIKAGPERGVFRSTDGGRSWTQTLRIDDATGIAKLARALDRPDVIFAASVRHWTPPGYAVGSFRSWQFGTVRPQPDTGRTGTALYKSLDGGVTWTELNRSGLPRLDGRLALSVAIGTNAQRVYMISNTALYRSDDGGATWRQMAADDTRIRNGQGGYSAGVYVDPKNPDLVYTINTAAYRSTDGGRTFTGMKGAPGGDDPQQMWIDPTDGRRMLLGLDQGATVSLDGGATWGSWYNQSTEQLYHLSVDNSFPYWVYATQQDAGAIRTRSRGNYGAITMFDWNAVSGWEWGTIIPDPLDDNTIFAAGNGIVRINYPSEQRINVSPAIDPATKARTTSSQPLLWAPWNKRRLFAGLQYVASTVDGGATWTAISPDLGVPAGMDSATATRTLGGRGAIESLAASTVTPGVIWAGTNNGLIHVTRDSGRTWSDVSIAGIPTPRRAMISSIDASHTNGGTAYVAVEYLRTGDHTPYLFRTRDYGKTWTSIVNGMPTDEPSGSFARVVREDPRTPGLLFAGTESGIHVSFDDGEHWQSLANDLPNSPVRDLLIKDDDLVIATHGRGLWVLDDISLLRQLRRATARIESSPVHLFAPGMATRMRRNVNDDTPLPPEIPHAENPLEGAIIDYWLGAAADRVTLDVLDAAGNVVRHFSSDAIAPVPEAARPPHPNFWVETLHPLPTSAGAHRINWNLRYDPPMAFSHSFDINANAGLTPASPEGPIVVPGTYTLRLVANGATRTQKVTVRNDPRSRATADALSRQLALQLRITTLMRSAWDAQQQVVALRASLAAARGAAGTSAAVVSALDALGAAIDSAVGPAGDGGRGGGTSFRSINGALAGQLGAQDHGDWAPTPSMRAALMSSCRDLEKMRSAWRRVLTEQAPAANAALARNGATAIALPRAAQAPEC